MKGKVNCTCGWSWNKSDSSKKDMYVCHNCGKDNENSTLENGGWLSKYEEGGPIRKQQDNYGEEINANEGYSTAGPGYVGEGTTNKGFNYNGAWGGTMQMGGSLPGAVGFTYARTINPAPSNGKYAKKTKASAQDGKKIKLNKNKSLQDNTKVIKQLILKKPFLIDPLTDQPATGDRLKLLKLKTSANAFKDNGSINTPYKKSVRENIIELANKADRRGENPVMGIVTEPVKAAMRLMRADKNFNFDSSNSADIARSIGEGALQTGMDALTVLPIAAEAVPFAKGISKSAIQKLAGIPSASSLPRLTAEELKIYRQVQDIGRMKATGKPYSQQLQHALDINLPEEHLQKIFNKSKSEIESAIPDQQQLEASRAANPFTDRINLQRSPRLSRQTDIATPPSFEDIYQMPASLRARVEAVQSNVNTSSSRNHQNLDDLFSQLDAGIHSSQRDDIIRNITLDYDIDRINNELNLIPEEIILNTGSNRGRTITNPQSPRLSLLETARDDWQRYVDNKVPTSEVIHNKFANIVSEYPYYKGPVLQNVPSLSLAGSGSLKNVSDKVASQSAFNISSGDVFTGSLNTSHSSYLPQLKQVFKYGEGSPQFLGYKPMNSMGFLSDYDYPSNDIAKYLNTEIDTQIGRGIIPKDIQRPYVKGKAVLLPHYGIKQFEEGGVIKDNMGQWNHPGEITKISSNQITMQGVPYPVMGVSNTGDTQMMYPEQDYQFDGESVTEYPMMKKGGWLNKYN